MSGDVLDQGVVIAFPGPQSFTGEDVAEIHVHGSTAVSRSVISALGRRLRLAQPGEFTRRALLSGRLDLCQVEGLGDLLAAETAAQQRQALASMRGAVSALAAEWRNELVRNLAFVEVTIDFADEELPSDVLISVRQSLTSLVDRMSQEIRGSRVAERLRDGFEVALVGRPNVGKSTLLNALAGREAALTASSAGTTRDVIEVRMDLAGLPLTLLDMAGLREAEGEVEARGVARARERAEAADLRLFLVESTAEVPSLGVALQPGDVVALAKADLQEPSEALAVSGLTGGGIDRLLDAITVALQERVASATSVAHARQREGVERAVRALRAAHAELGMREPRTELAAEELRSAIRALDFVTGRVDVEAVLDAVFANFCLGK